MDYEHKNLSIFNFSRLVLFIHGEELVAGLVKVGPNVFLIFLFLIFVVRVLLLVRLFDFIRLLSEEPLLATDFDLSFLLFYFFGFVF